MRCIAGVNTGLPGFSARDDKGNLVGIDVDFCRAITAGDFRRREQGEMSRPTAKERFTGSAIGKVDVLSRNSTWTTSRDSEH